MLKLLLLTCLVGAGAATACADGQIPKDARLPNVVVLFADDLGYGDLGCYGAKGIRTPHLDRLAQEGTQFTSFYVAQAVCTASRAALMTGCYPNRVGLFGALNHRSDTGIHEAELLLPELFKQRGYATAIFGKWHLGHRSKFLPTRHGFDTFFGIPYSNDNGPLHPIVRDIPALPLFEGEKVVAHDPDQRQFTRWFTERAVQFISDNKNRPFFLYVPHVMPHVPLHVSDAFKGKSQGGLYGDVVEELDWGVGEVLAALKQHGLEQNTLVIFLSDNGPFLSYGNHAGSAGPLREGKLTTFEGGVRVPCLMRWPGKIPAGVRNPAMVGTIDLLPTFGGLIGSKLSGLPLDGRDAWPVLTGQPGTKATRNVHYYYAGEELQAVRQGAWKLHFPHEYLSSAEPPGKDGKPANFANLRPEAMSQSGLRGIASRHGYVVKEIGLSLYNLDEDVGETTNVADRHPDVVRRLHELADRAREELGDTLTKRTGKGIRPVGKQ